MFKSALRLIFSILVAGILVWGIRFFGCSIVEIPEDGERPVFMAGDRVALNKWSYGIRLSPMKWLDKARLGDARVGLGEWVAFNDPSMHDDSIFIDERNIFIGYCYAVPGDTLWVDRCGNIFRYMPPSGRPFKKVRLPQKGEFVGITPDNVYWYNSMINLHEGLCSEVVSDSLYVAGQLVTSFRFMHDYYWMSSANCENQLDSRTFGFVPDIYIIGRLTRVLYSFDDAAPWYNPFRWDRTMMKVGCEKPDIQR